MSKGHEHRQFFTFSLELNFLPVFSRVEFIPSPRGVAFGQNIYPCSLSCQTLCLPLRYVSVGRKIVVIIKTTFSPSEVAGTKM